MERKFPRTRPTYTALFLFLISESGTGASRSPRFRLFCFPTGTTLDRSIQAFISFVDLNWVDGSGIPSTLISCEIHDQVVTCLSNLKASYENLRQGLKDH
jgi:hypothetical protein